MSTSGGNLDLLKLTLNYLSPCVLFCEEFFDFAISLRSDYSWNEIKYGIDAKIIKTKAFLKEVFFG